MSGEDLADRFAAGLELLSVPEVVVGHCFVSTRVASGFVAAEVFGFAEF